LIAEKTKIKEPRKTAEGLIILNIRDLNIEVRLSGGPIKIGEVEQIVELECIINCLNSRKRLWTESSID